MKRSSYQFSLLEVTMVIGIIIMAAAVTVTLIDPIQRLAETRDVNRTTTVNTIKTAVDAYAAIKGMLPDCSQMQECPNKFRITGTDPLSQALLTNRFLSTIPSAESDFNLPNECRLSAYLFPKSIDKYLISWCYESWNKSHVESLNPNIYNCSWNEKDKIAICFAGTDYEIPAP